MAIFETGEFNHIKYDTFLTTELPPRIQPLSNREVTLEYVYANNDFDILKRYVDKDFYKIPSVSYIVKHDDRIDNLAFKFYKDPDYWWILMMFNKLIDPFTLEDVVTLNIPNVSKLYLYLTRQRMKYLNK